MKRPKKRSKLRKRIVETHFFRRGVVMLIDFIIIYLISVPLYAVLFLILASVDPEYKNPMQDLMKVFTLKSEDGRLSLLGELILKKSEEEIEKGIAEAKNALEKEDIEPLKRQRLLEKLREDEKKLKKIQQEKRERGSAEDPEERLEKELVTSTESMFVSLEKYKWVQEILVAYTYFTLFFFFKGQTPAKRMLGLKVVKRDGSKLNLWEAFERSHGYACSLLLIFMGFFQVLWDKHSLTMHDKIAETKVIRVKKIKKTKKTKKKTNIKNG